MRDAYGGKTWFRIETEAEAAAESRVMRHKIEKYFCQERDKAIKSFQPSSGVLFEQEIGLTAHIQREMPLFLTLRDGEGNALVTAMLPPGGRNRDGFSPIIVGSKRSIKHSTPSSAKGLTARLTTGADTAMTATGDAARAARVISSVPSNTLGFLYLSPRLPCASRVTATRTYDNEHQQPGGAHFGPAPLTPSGG